MIPNNVDEHHWQDDANCATTDPELFTPKKGESAEPAKAICAMCPVQKMCLEYALTNNQNQGIWGGMAPRERRKLKKGNTIRPAKTHCRNGHAYTLDNLYIGRNGTRVCRACALASGDKKRKAKAAA